MFHLMEMAKKELSGKKTLTEIAFELGYSSNQHFSMAFKKKFGLAPSQLRASVHKSTGLPT